MNEQIDIREDAAVWRKFQKMKVMKNIDKESSVYMTRAIIARRFETIVRSLYDGGLTINQIAQKVCICNKSVKKILTKEEVEIRNNEDEQPEDAEYYPEPNGAGFVLRPEEYERLVKIHMLKKCYGNMVKIRRYYEARPFEPQDPYNRKIDL